jgi:class 3 adenylate cyclase
MIQITNTDPIYFIKLTSPLEQACQLGEIYLSHATWGQVKDQIHCEEVGTIEVKGFQYPIQTYRVLQQDVNK